MTSISTPAPASRTHVTLRASAPEPGTPGAHALGLGRLPTRLWRRTFVTAPIAVGATLLTRVLGGTVVAIPPAFAPLQIPPIGVLTAVGLHLAAAVLALCFRFAAHPLRLYRRVAMGVLIASAVPDLALLLRRAPGATPGTVGLLLLLHLVAGVVGVWLLPALAVGRGGAATAEPSTPAASPFRNGARSFGTFYPRHYVLAVYADAAAARRAVDALNAAGFAGDDVLTASGATVVAHEQAMEVGRGALARVGEQWARLYTDASAASRRLRDAAEHGAAFVLAYAPEDDRVARAADALRPFGPDVLHHFGTFTVTKLS